MTFAKWKAFHETTLTMTVELFHLTLHLPSVDTANADSKDKININSLQLHLKFKQMIVSPHHHNSLIAHNNSIHNISTLHNPTVYSRAIAMNLASRRFHSHREGPLRGI